MRFFALYETLYDGVEQRLSFLKDSCRSLNIDFFALNSVDTDYSRLPSLGTGDLLYNCADGSELLESLLINQDVTTFYMTRPLWLSNNADTIKYYPLHEKLGLPVPRTIYAVTPERSLLKRYVDHLGGFPLVIKSLNSTRGLGTIKIESWHALYSTVDFLCTQQIKFVLREFVQAEFGVRVIVLGGRALLTRKFHFQENDFRNAPVLSLCRYESIDLDPALVEVCVNAVNVLGLELGGVDIMMRNGELQALLEVNFPIGFQSFIDDPLPVTNELLSYLVKKANQVIAYA